jgi:hypothetical protein
LSWLLATIENACGPYPPISPGNTRAVAPSFPHLTTGDVTSLHSLMHVKPLPALKKSGLSDSLGFAAKPTWDVMIPTERLQIAYQDSQRVGQMDSDDISCEVITSVH